MMAMFMVTVSKPPCLLLSISSDRNKLESSIILLPALIDRFVKISVFRDIEQAICDP